MMTSNPTQSIHRIHTIDSDIHDILKDIEQKKSALADAKYLRITLRRQFDFIKTQKEADELTSLAKIYPEIMSGRELQIIFHILQFKTNKEISAACFLSDKGVKYHKTKIFNKLDCIGEKGLFKIHAERTKDIK